MAISTVTKSPTGLSIARNGSKVTISWKIGDSDYGGGQKLRYKIGSDGWKSIDVGKTATSKVLTVPVASYYPAASKKLSKIIVYIRGKRKSYTKKVIKNKKTVTETVNPGWSDWAVKTYTLTIPNMPTLSASLSENYTNICTFAWSVSVSATDARWFYNVEYQSMLVKNCGQTDGSKLSWKSSQAGWRAGTGGASASVAITEDTSLIAGDSWTRWFRVRSRGAGGASGWRYAKHVYALPYQAVIKSASASVTNAGGFRCKVVWEATSNAAHPIDNVSVQYCITVPDAGMQCPNGASWSDAGTSADTSGNDAAAFSIDDTLSDDQCLFVRVNTKHDTYTTYGTAKLASVGKLANPSNVSVETDNATFRATITATNNSKVQDAFLAILYRPASDPAGAFPVGVIASGFNSATVQCPDWSGEEAVAFGVYAVVGSYAKKNRSDGVSSYAVTAKMESAALWDGGAVPTAPSGVTAAATDIPGTIRVTWGWTWSGADSAEISWADHSDAWESTDEPETYIISHLHAAQWNISGLSTGVTWYVRVRLISSNNDDLTYGPWSDMVSIDLSSAPSVPTMVLDQSVITADGSVTASWAYSSTDGTAQAYAEICEAAVGPDGIVYSKVIAHTETAQHVSISAKDAGWDTGNIYNLCVRVTSASGHTSDNWSDPVAITIAEPLTAEITSTSLENVTVVDDEEEGIARTVLSLTEMPLSLTVTGAGAGGTTTVAIERAADYHMERPDETAFNGFEGETIALITQTGEGTVNITTADLIGLLDDGAGYRIVATVQDGFGQSDETTLDFEIHWSHQAAMPEATAEIDGYIAKITPAAPEGYAAGDTCDIYRLSSDRPELIVKDAAFGTTYVDPYPAIGENGGHRVVYKTSNGDYITADNRPAWIDLQLDDNDYIGLDQAIIDFGGHQLFVTYNMELSNTWAKDFQETKYLGGSVQGDWNPAVSRTASLSTTTVTTQDNDVIRALRELAVYAGICHIRTMDGSSYAADIQVSESRSYAAAGKLAEFSLDITRVDTQGYEGMTLEQWQDEGAT